jgi:hypothetical protein
MPRTPPDLAAAIGVAPDPTRSFDWTHLGQSELPIGSLLRLLRADPALCPPRSGHLGNWEDIALGRAGAMDFNQAICASGLGYPLIYAFNQTEDATLTAGDWVYLPGSLASRGGRVALPLSTRDGAGWARRGHDHPLFVPFVRTEQDGETLPLTQVHWRRMQAIAERSAAGARPLRFRLEAAIIHAHRARLAPMLVALLEAASRRDNPRRGFADLISHAAALDGRVTRTSIRRDAAGYWLDDDCFASTEALVDATFLVFEAVADPDAFFARIGRTPALPPRLPVMAGLLVGVLSAILATHYPDVAIDRDTMTRPYNLHFHWGARDMAGYPPRRKGYFSERTTTRSIRQICDTLVSEFSDVDPVYFALMPAALFLLCPADVHPGDGAALAELFARVAAGTAVYAGSTDDRMMTEVDRIVRDWLATAQATLSPYFLNRFTARRGVLHDTEVPEASRAAEPDGFGELNLRQACMIIGALTDALGRPT